MQTIKTAAIFIFVGTVMWGAYTSLTTPPESLPEDVQELMFDHEPAIAFDEGSFDAGLADSLPELEINSGEPAVVMGPDSNSANDAMIAANASNIGQPFIDGPADYEMPTDGIQSVERRYRSDCPNLGLRGNTTSTTICID